MSKTISLGTLAGLLLSIPSIGSAGSWFAGYEFGEMALNKFKHFAGEVGYNFDNNHALRFGVINVALSERHLSSSEASVVEGENVKGLWHGLDVYYDYPLTERIFVSPSIGYHENEYTHTILGTSVNHSTATAGFALSYVGDIIQSVEALYWRFSLTFKYRFKDQEDTRLGDAVVSGGSYDIVPLIFVGYEFD